MIKKASEIFKSWQTSFNPTDSQAELAAKRAEICNTCEFKKTTPFDVCGACGCPLQKKIYSPRLNACPHSKWSEVEQKYLIDR